MPMRPARSSPLNEYKPLELLRNLGQLMLDFGINIETLHQSEILFKFSYRKEVDVDKILSFQIWPRLFFWPEVEMTIAHKIPAVS